jgi:Protein of unknown function (DUF2752)
MTPALHGRIAVIMRAAAPPALLITIVTVLLRFPPAQNTFYPRCPIYTVLHLQCPGYGGTRALAALLHGHMNEALHFNALVTLLLPIAFFYGFLCYLRFLQRRPHHWPQLTPAAIHAALAIAAIFTVLRNLP